MASNKGSSYLLIDHPSPGKGNRQLANPAFQGLEAMGSWQGSNQPQTTPKTDDFGPKSGVSRQQAKVNFANWLLAGERRFLAASSRLGWSISK